MAIIFRNDDVNANTNFRDLDWQYQVFRGLYPDCEIWSCITLFSKEANGSVYPEVPFKDKEVNWFYEANQIIDLPDGDWGEIVSHGLYHIDHSKVSRETQEMSILGSCSYLNSPVFVPPFNRYNDDTVEICEDNMIHIVRKEDWKSLEYEPFDPEHKYWYYHSWRWTPEELIKKLVKRDYAGQKY